MSGWYNQLVRPLLFRMDPETAHHFALRSLRWPGAHAALRNSVAHAEARLEIAAV